jgi:hypothetical protein
VPAIAWVAAHAVYLHRGPLVHLLLAYPSGRTTSRVTRGAEAVAEGTSSKITRLLSKDGSRGFSSRL